MGSESWRGRKNLTYPFKLIDQIVSLNGNQCTTLKNISANEWYMVKNNLGLHDMPMSMLIECMGQTAGLLEENRPGQENKQAIFVSINGLEFFSPVKPGMQLITQATVKTQKRIVTTYQVESRVDKKCVAKGEFDFGSIGISNA